MARNYYKLSCNWRIPYIVITAMTYQVTAMLLNNLINSLVFITKVA